ncbi:MAG: efflux RND transporter periplasmic adaptor subunit [Steroidobacteraceae bacterium]|jgi:membrane fusion protein (multidrug efflux system)
MNTPAPGTPTPVTSAANRQRRRWLTLGLGGAALLGLAFTAYWAHTLRYRQYTDDAYVSGNIVLITPQISGTVIGIGVDDTQFVTAGAPLVRLDPADAKVALDQAEAQLAKTVREVRTLYATSSQLQALVDLRRSDLAMAQQDLARRERLGSSGAISSEELQHARDAARSAAAALLSTEQQLRAGRARTDGTNIEDHPDVRNAAAQVRSAYLAYSRTILPAPVDGFVAKRNVQLGQRVSPGLSLMAVVPLDQVWVDANFKEPQLAAMRVGQPVTLTADLYGHSVIYHGTVAGFGAGTGSVFSLLPAQNATGNWIKIIQRVPVRVALAARELAANPLQIGLSMRAEVDTHERGGARLPQRARKESGYSTDVFGANDLIADQRVRAIILANDTAYAAEPIPGHGRLASADAPASRSARNDGSHL